MVHPIHYLVTALGVLSWAVPGAAQRPTATISGRVVDRRSGAPIAAAQVALLGTHRECASDSGGRFSQDSLTAGPYLLQIRAIGYSTSTWVVRLDTGQVLDRDFDLAPAVYTLPPITREAAPGLMALRLRDFERRKAQGRGVFITEDDIQRTNAVTLSDLLRTAAGVQVVCNSAGCTARMTRAATAVCRPDFFVDGLSANFSTTANLPTVGIVAIEVYRSGSEAPVEFLRADTDCGVIVIWTRSAPNP
jgi:carboxypeptidase family protein/TonB-dependent receptor-like protein